MKKLFISALLACTASVSFAQDAVKQVMAATDYQEALNLLNSSLSSMSNEDKAKAYSKVAELAVKKFNKESEVALTNQVAKQNNPYDKEGMNAAAIAAMNAALECDKYDQMPNEKGKVKPKFRSKMAQMMAPVAPLSSTQVRMSITRKTLPVLPMPLACISRQAHHLCSSSTRV